MKFFRKLRLRFLHKKRFGKYLAYAMGEIGLIMIGILLAMQVSEWNLVKKDRAEEELILKRFSSELGRNQEKLSALLSGLDRKEEALERVDAVFNGKPIGTDSTFLSDVVISSLWGWTVQPLQRLIFEEINNTGRLSIIQDLALRDQITKLYDLIELYEGTALARTSDYAKITYALVPREHELRFQSNLGSLKQRTLVQAVLRSNLRQAIIFEQNRTRYLQQIWNAIQKSIAPVRESIETEIKR